MTPAVTRGRRAVLFDLDDTLFDHARATRVALADIRAGDPSLVSWSLDEFDRRHRVVLDRLHQEVLAGRASIETARIARFRELLEASGGKSAGDRAPHLASRYRSIYETAWFVVPGAHDLIDALVARGFAIGIVTNNVVAEQRLKLERCQLTPKITALITSEEIGVQKPDTRIFEAALDRLNVDAADAVMVGDAWGTDIEGALRAGIRAVWINRFGEVRHHAQVTEIQSFEPVADALRAIVPV